MHYLNNNPKNKPNKRLHDHFFYYENISKPAFLYYNSTFLFLTFTYFVFFLKKKQIYKSLL